MASPAGKLDGADARSALRHLLFPLFSLGLLVAGDQLIPAVRAWVSQLRPEFQVALVSLIASLIRLLQRLVANQTPPESTHDQPYPIG